MYIHVPRSIRFVSLPKNNVFWWILSVEINIYILLYFFLLWLKFIYFELCILQIFLLSTDLDFQEICVGYLFVLITLTFVLLLSMVWNDEKDNLIWFWYSHRFIRYFDQFYFRALYLPESYGVVLNVINWKPLINCQQFFYINFTNIFYTYQAN